ncbi:metal ABC transporter solute-binding protein, Zn/Mn family [Thalassobacillus sp. CUG 92003]|uniref:metal ABC transporter solute-binding protein, Zn/Mn family n=1 Tax=Thalassobacillus sp. CUG 92003 TaxID=2736641 RepID=UPI0015E6A371|nr:zinc ABC transporter substrate-binding protein [Thalassobacillus sp. CUG 92003]
MKYGLKMFAGMLTVAMISACSSDSSSGGSSEDETIKVTTTIAQIGNAVEEIGGEHVEVVSLMGPGIDPHLYQATQSDLKKLQNAEVIFYNGLNLEGQMHEVFENMSDHTPTVAIGDTLPDDVLREDMEDDNKTDPHIWFDIEIWKTAISNITDTLSEEDPAHAEAYQQNEEAYFEELDELHDYAKEQTANIPENQRVLVTAHDAFNYFGNAYDMEVKGLQGLSTDAEYGLADIQDLVGTLVSKNIKAVFIESSVSEKSINAVIKGAEKQGHNVTIGGELYSDAMGEDGTEEGTYIGMYRHNVDTIVKALK